MAGAQDIHISKRVITAEEIQGQYGLDLVARIKPTWAKDKVVQKVLQGGFINCMVAFFNGEDKRDGIVFRVYSEVKLGEETMRDTEAMCMQLAHHMECFPPVVGFFHNGLATGFANGHTLRKSYFEEQPMIRKIARALCSFHNSDLKACKLLNRFGEPSKFDDTFAVYFDMRKKVNALPEQLANDETKAKRLAANNLSRTRLLEEIDFLERTFEPLNLHKALCHYDFHHGNALYDDESGRVTVLDFEMTRVGYEAFDVCGLFYEIPWRSLVPGFFKEGDIPTFTEEIKRTWAREYAIKKREMKGNKEADVTDAVVDAWYWEHELMNCIFQMAWLCSFLVILEQPMFKLPALEFIDTVYKDYMVAKERLPVVKAKFLAARTKAHK